GGIAAHPGSRLSQASGRSLDRRTGRRSRGTVSDLRGNRVHRYPRAPPHERSAESFGLAGAAGSSARGAGLSLAVLAEHDNKGGSAMLELSDIHSSQKELQ